MLSECLHETLQNDERRFIVKQNKTKYSHGENGQVWLALGQIFTTLHLMIHSRAFFLYIFYVSTFWKVLCPFFNDNIYKMWLQYFWWNFGGSAIRHVIS